MTPKAFLKCIHWQVQTFLPLCLGCDMAWEGGTCLRREGGGSGVQALTNLPDSITIRVHSRSLPHDLDRAASFVKVCGDPPPSMFL